MYVWSSCAGLGWKGEDEDSWPGQLYPRVQQTNAYTQRLAGQGEPKPFLPCLFLGLTPDHWRGPLLSLGTASTYILLKIQMPQKEEHIQFC